MTKIDKKIIGFSIVDTTATPPAPITSLTERSPVLSGKTCKLKTPLSEHALYVTINDQDGRPFEIFINCKAMEHFQWIVALTRVMSAVFRQGGNVTFLAEELMAVVDPKGGYFFRGQYRASLVAEIGGILKTHLTGLGLIIEDTSLADAAKEMVKAKLEKSEKPTGSLCAKCNELSVVILDGC